MCESLEKNLMHGEGAFGWSAIADLADSTS